jgi:hypothetical protein
MLAKLHMYYHENWKLFAKLACIFYFLGKFVYFLGEPIYTSPPSLQFLVSVEFMVLA